MKLHSSINHERIQDAIEEHETGLAHPGFCTHCGADADQVEPDAEKYFCETCEKPAVYGIEWIAIEAALKGF
jgi:hypothetical protein